jgi:hypothetical protein
MHIGSIIRVVSALESLKRRRARVWDVCDRVDEQVDERRRRVTDRKIAARQTLTASHYRDSDYLKAPRSS